MATLVAASTHDRLGFTIFIAVALHLMLILGVYFPDFKPKVAPTLNITLSTHKSQFEPDEADFLAENNQDGSGTLDEVKELSTDNPADLQSPNPNEILPEPQERTTSKSDSQKEYLKTESSSNIQVVDQAELKDAQDSEDKEAQDEDIPIHIQEKRALMEQLARMQQREAKRPKIRIINSVRAKSSVDAKYLLGWSQRVEKIAYTNFPQEAFEQNIVGEVRVAVALNADGTVHKIDVIRPSKHPILNQAVVQITHIAAPFEKIPADVLDGHDKLEIIRTWQFRRRTVDIN